MKTADSVSNLGLYTSKCCGAELIFDTSDQFLRCPSCDRPCRWELEAELLTQEDLERMDTMDTVAA